MIRTLFRTVLFVCFHGVENAPRALGQALHANVPYKVLQIDYLFLGEGDDDYKYALVLNYDFNGYA